MEWEISLFCSSERRIISFSRVPITLQEVCLALEIYMHFNQIFLVVKYFIIFKRNLEKYKRIQSYVKSTCNQKNTYNHVRMQVCSRYYEFKRGTFNSDCRYQKSFSEQVTFTERVCVCVKLPRYKKWDLIPGKQNISIVHEKIIRPNGSSIPLVALTWVGR